MPMCGWSNRVPMKNIWADRTGSAAVEFAFLLPLLMLLIVGLTDYGRALIEANAVNKGVRAAAIYAARSAWPLSAASATTARNLARTGTLDGTGALLAPGWGDSAATLAFVTESYVLGSETIPVIRVDASIPYKPLLPGLAGLIGLDGFKIEVHHEQAWIGT